MLLGIEVVEVLSQHDPVVGWAGLLTQDGDLATGLALQELLDEGVPDGPMSHNYDALALHDSTARQR